jgi:hypothetical protein
VGEAISAHASFSGFFVGESALQELGTSPESLEIHLEKIADRTWSGSVELTNYQFLRPTILRGIAPTARLALATFPNCNHPFFWCTATDWTTNQFGIWSALLGRALPGSDKRAPCTESVVDGPPSEPSAFRLIFLFLYGQGMDLIGDDGCTQQHDGNKEASRFPV